MIINEKNSDGNDLVKMLNIVWKRGSDLPQGFQDSDVGFIGNSLVTVCGFCQGREYSEFPDRYPRGFLKKVWALDVDAGNGSWTPLPDFPGEARQALSCIVIKDVLYCWGGFSYTEPFCYRDGYRFYLRNGEWIWEELPHLPWPLASAGICSVGSVIYISGGMDFDNELSYTWSDRTGQIDRMGAKLLAFDTEKISDGWRIISEIPGVSRSGHAMASIGDSIYIIGGVTGQDWPGLKYESGSDASISGTYAGIVDNWKYDSSEGSWTRLPDTPISTAGFPDNKIVFKDRYILLIGGYQYDNVANPDGTTGEKYGKASMYNGEGEYFNDVLVYDTYKNMFGRTDYLPLNNFCPGAVMRENELYLIGGETGGSVIDGRFYGHHPELCLIGRVEEIR